ncbi:Sodium-dependent neutral amino acid transporter B(0)AT2 [Microtus ochrogaster]|uniref:Sodium-dependent neutral amino acid transporter B(0)AT2 n=1 Tax=Microtus ochrogaster TaxID=79684 RepID=A0A8J6GW41_MICOH|nr:Sodium-dependent neutral amino acid transporter B(0)AT2 [Microtus ochrogaster]
MLIFSIFFPYVLLCCFLIRSLFLPGVMASLRRLVTIEASPSLSHSPGLPGSLLCRPHLTWEPSPPQLSILSSLHTWHQAGGHVLYSLGLGMGTIITFSSYQTRGDNHIKLASFMAMANLVTLLLSTVIIFLVLDFWTITSRLSCVEK